MSDNTDKRGMWDSSQEGLPESGTGQVAGQGEHLDRGAVPEPAYGGVHPQHGGGSHYPATGGGGSARSLLLGILGGLIAAGAVALALWLTGVVSFGPRTVSAGPGGTGGSGTINITANAADASTAEVVAAKAMPSVVSVNCTFENGKGLGSGVILDADGNIITNYHVINGATSISVRINDKSYPARLVGSDPSSDLAVIRADLGGDSVTPMEVGDSDSLKVGSWVMTIGSPFGLDQSVSAGIVSALYRNTMLDSKAGETIYANLIQVDASINPGNSGGALVNDRGQLVGISTLFSSDTESFAGIGFAIPGNYAVDIAKQIISGQQVTHAYIGLTMQTVNATNARANGLSVNQGAYVTAVTPDGPADKAGIKPGDIIIAVDGKEVASASGMILEVRSHQIGSTITVTVMRGGEKMNFEVTLGSDEPLQQQRPNGSGGSGDVRNQLEKWIEEHTQNNNTGAWRGTEGSMNGASAGDGQALAVGAEGWVG